MVPNVGIFVSLQNFVIRKIEGADFKYDNIIFIILDKFEDAGFKYDNSIFKFQPRNMQIRHFWSQICGFLFFAPNFALRQILGC